MKNILFLLLYYFTIYGMETENAGIELQKLGSETKVSWHDDVKDNEIKDHTPIGTVPKPPSLNTQLAWKDRGVVDTPKRQSKEEQVLDACCPSCWPEVKDTFFCAVFVGCAEAFVTMMCSDCCINPLLTKKNKVKEDKEEVD